jgi:hypothetical protein
VKEEVPSSPQPEVALPAPQPPQVKKSIFDFVSPFDVFEKPKPVPTSKAAPPPVRASAAPTSKQEQTSASPQPTTSGQPSTPLEDVVPEATQSQPISTSAKAGNGNGLPKSVNTTRGTKHGQRQASGASSGSAGSGKGDLGLVWQVGKVVEKGIEGKG